MSAAEYLSGSKFRNSNDFQINIKTDHSNLILSKLPPPPKDLDENQSFNTDSINFN